jgi:hypothetical protein
MISWPWKNPTPSPEEPADPSLLSMVVGEQQLRIQLLEKQVRFLFDQLRAAGVPGVIPQLWPQAVVTPTPLGRPSPPTRQRTDKDVTVLTREQRLHRQREQELRQGRPVLTSTGEVLGEPPKPSPEPASASAENPGASTNTDA